MSLIKNMDITNNNGVKSMDEFGRKNNYKRYEYILVILLSINSIVNNITITSNIINQIGLFSMMLIFMVGIIFDISKFNSLSHYIYLIFLACFLVLFRFSFFSFSIASLAIDFLFIPVNNIVSIYRKIIIVQLIYGFLTSLAGLSPLKNPQTGVLTFGFVNENGIGILLAILVLTFLFTEKNGQLVFNLKWYNIVFTILITGIEVLLFNDNTAALMIVFFFLLLPLKEYFLKNRVFQLVSFLIPIGLAVFAFWVSFNYSITSATWVNKLNSLMTWRIDIWHYYLTNYPLTYFPSKLQTNNKILFGAFDGTYTYLGLFNGLIMLVIIVIGLALANIRLLLNKKFYIFAFLLCFEISGFAENIVINYYQCFALVFAILAYSKNWLKD